MSERKVIHKGNIGNALHSVAPDHITTTAYEVFDEKSQIYQESLNATIGGYDISVNTAVDNVPTPYPNIEAALGTDGENIPDDIKQIKGLIVKYIQSPENVYVVCKLKTEVFSVNPNNWETSDSINSLKGNKTELSIVDKNDNAILKLLSYLLVDALGTIKTKNFDSSEIKRVLTNLVESFTTTFPEGNPKSFSVEDRAGNAILRLLNYLLVDAAGNIKTKNFDSATIKSDLISLFEQLATIFPGGESNSFSVEDRNGNSILKLLSYLFVDSEGNLKTKNFDSKSIKTVIDDNTNFLISDSQDNILLKLLSYLIVDNDGNLKTKAFDSSKSLSAIVDNPNNLSITDKYDNVILQLLSYLFINSQGDIQTKSFDSSKLKVISNNADSLSIEDLAGNSIVKINKAGHLKTKSFDSSKVIIVDINGGGNYTSLEDAIANAGDSYGGKSATIIVMPGTYIMNTPADDSNREVFYNRNINIIGIDRDKCILKGTVGYYTHSGTEGVTEPRDYATLKLGGNCYIANLTIINTDDDFQMPADDSGNPEERHRSYCIHFDYYVSGRWTAHVDNCILINDHNTCVGCGVRGKVIFTDCIAETTIYDPAQRGHMCVLGAHETPGFDDNEFFVKDCILTGHNNPCIGLFNVYNQKMYATFINNVVFNEAGGPVFINDGGTYHTKTKYCFGNNNSELNY